MANITASSQRSPLQYSRKEYGQYKLAADQTTNISATDPVKFAVCVAGNIAFNSATYTWTLKANKTYKMSAGFQIGGSGATTWVSIQWKTTGGTLLGIANQSFVTTYASNVSSFEPCEAIYTPTVDTDVRVVIGGIGANTTTFYAALSYATITEIDTYTPAVYGGQYAYVSPLILLTVTGTNYVSVRAVGIFYKTTNGTWRMKFNLTGTMTATNSRALTIAGVVFKNTTEYYQSVSSHSNANTVYNTHAYCNPNAGTIQYTFSNNTTVIRSSGDVELDAKPTVAGIPSDV